MSRKKMIEAVAEGIKGELDGIAVYEAAAARSEGDVKAFFLERAEEEKMHYNWLAAYYQKLLISDESSNSDIMAGKIPSKPSPIISRDFLERVGTDRFLSAAISSAVLLELNAIKHYSENVDTSDDPDVKKLFSELAAWEKEHYEMLLKIQDDAREFWFQAQKFEPF